MALAAALAEWDVPTTSNEGARRYRELAAASAVLRTYLHPRDISSPDNVKPSETDAVRAAVASLRRMDKIGEVYRDFLNSVEARFFLVKRDISRYINRLQEASALSKTPQAQTDEIMVEFLERLASWQRVWGSPLKSFDEPRLITQYTAFFSSLLHASLPASFPSSLESFLSSSLASFSQTAGTTSHHAPIHSRSHRMTSALSPHAGAGLSDRSVPAPPSPHLGRLAILSRYGTTLVNAAYREIERIVREESERGWDVRRMGRARQRVGEGVASWLTGMYEGNEGAQNALRPMFSRFDYCLCKCFFDARTDELFDIIVDYPESIAALEDLKECLFKVNQRDILVDKLKAANVKRLLHPGAETEDVITQYISTIRCLRILDPQGVLLHKVAEPIRRHLRDRPDTIRCIVAALVEGEELQDENDQAGGIIGQGNEEGVERFDDPKWEPEPIDAAPEFRSGKASDIISTLVSIYESREVIIKELQILLATRLLAVKDYDAVREIRTIELLKIRFGEVALQICDVMLKDMADSKRIDDRVQGDAKSVVHPLIISRMFWPNIQASSLRLPPRLEAAQRDYELAFHHFKPDKRLRWLQHIGTAQIKLELSDRVVETEATPLQAAIAELFEGQDRWNVASLVERLGMNDQAMVRNALVFWAGLGVVKEEMSGGVAAEWRLLEVAEEVGVVRQAYVEEAPVIQSVDESRAEQVRVHWNYIKGVLTNLGPRNVDFIHSMLGYVDDYAQTVEELGMFMAAARREGLVDLGADGAWALVG